MHARANAQPTSDGDRTPRGPALPARISCSQYASSSPTETTFKAIRSGSVIGVDCRYNTLGFNAKTSAPAAAAIQEPVRTAMIHAMPLTVTANDSTEMATADAPVR